MGKIRKTRPQRINHGFSLIEVMLATILAGFLLAVIGELALLLTKATLSTWNKTEGLAAARFAVSRISNDVRHARAFGDLHAPIQDRQNFPSGQNPDYPPSPLQGWPQAPWKPIPMILSDSLLIIQEPVFLEFNSSTPPGIDSSLEGVPIVHVGTNNLENVNTVVYEVVPDQERIGEYLLQVATFTGQINFPSKVKPITPPQTVLKGIIGPTRGGGSSPSVFSYWLRSSSSLPFTKSYTPTGADVDAIRGIAIDFEVKTPNSKTNDGSYPQTMAVHSEAFARSNNQMLLRYR